MIFAPAARTPLYKSRRIVPAVFLTADEKKVKKNHPSPYPLSPGERVG
jgi:hypothetical protein